VGATQEQVHAALDADLWLVAFLFFHTGDTDTSRVVV
jgi:hypothetical protein